LKYPYLYVICSVERRIIDFGLAHLNWPSTALSCQVDDLVVPIWPYQFFNALRSDRQYEPNIVLLVHLAFGGGARQQGVHDYTPVVILHSTLFQRW